MTSRTPCMSCFEKSGLPTRVCGKADGDHPSIGNGIYPVRVLRRESRSVRDLPDHADCRAPLRRKNSGRGENKFSGTRSIFFACERAILSNTAWRPDQAPLDRSWRTEATFVSLWI